MTIEPIEILVPLVGLLTFVLGYMGWLSSKAILATLTLSMVMITIFTIFIENYWFAVSALVLVHTTLVYVTRSDWNTGSLRLNIMKLVADYTALALAVLIIGSVQCLG
jgi:hypothetical protein